MKEILLRNIRQVIFYNKWASQRLIGNVNKITDEDYYKVLPVPFNNIQGLLLHLYYYDAKYYQILTEQLNLSEVEKQLPRACLVERILLSSSNWLDWIEKLIQANQLPEFFDEVSKNIFDLSAHNNYHRGQINTIASFIGYKPESLDIYLYNDKFSG